MGVDRNVEGSHILRVCPPNLLHFVLLRCKDLLSTTNQETEFETLQKLDDSAALLPSQIAKVEVRARVQPQPTNSNPTWTASD